MNYHQPLVASIINYVVANTITTTTIMWGAFNVIIRSIITAIASG